MLKERFIVYMTSHDIQTRFYLETTFEELEEWIGLNNKLLQEGDIQCAITDSLDNFVATNNNWPNYWEILRP